MRQMERSLHILAEGKAFCLLQRILGNIIMLGKWHFYRMMHKYKWSVDMGKILLLEDDESLNRGISLKLEKRRVRSFKRHRSAGGEGDVPGK